MSDVPGQGRDVRHIQVMVDRRSRPMHVLVVEDHAMVAQALAFTLADEGFAVLVSDGSVAEEVLGTAAEFRPAVVLLDLYLGRRDCLPLIGPLVSGGAKVIIVTGSTNRTVHGECLMAGATAVIEKSEDLPRLVRAVVDAGAGTAVMHPAEKEALVRTAERHRSEATQLSARFEALTSRERQVLAALVEGRAADQIAEQEFVSLATVRTHIRVVLRKLEVRSQLAAVALATRSGWTP